MTLNEYRAQFSNKYREYLRQLADVGTQTAEMGFASNGYVGDNNGVSVQSEMEDTGFRITATGEAVSFIEFGTGVATSVSPLVNVQADYDIRPGSWSEEHAKQFSTNGFWRYKGEYLEGTPPAAGMQNACITMQYRAQEIARRVFK